MAAAISIGLLATHLLLLLCTGTATRPAFPAVVNGAADPPAAPAADIGGGGGLPKLKFPLPGKQPKLPFPFPGGNNPVAGADCLNAVHQAESCVGDVLRSLASSSSSPVEDAVRAGSKACCAALQAVGDRCFRGVLPVSPFRVLFAPIVKHACGNDNGGGGGLLPGLVDLLVPGPRA